MGKLALTHRGRAVVLPPPELLEPCIERTDNHWYWLGEFFDDGLDRSAEFHWTPPAERATNFMVPRLLWQYANPAEKHGRNLLENTCGLFTCINPAHWSLRRGGVRIPPRIVLPEHVEAFPVVHGDDVVLVHIQRNNTNHTVCGATMSSMRGGAKTTAVTCDECISGWVRTGNAFTEVK